MLNIVDIMRLASDRTPDAPCTVWKGRRRTYSEMLNLVGSIRRELEQRGVSQGAYVVTAGSSSDLMLATYMANAALGGITVPLSSMLTLDEARDIITRTGAKQFVSGPEHGYKAEQLAELETEFDNTLDLEDWERHADAELPSAPLTLGPAGGDSPAMIIFTSGSTGRPKGCVKTHANLISHAVNRQISMPRRPADHDLYVIPPGGIGFGNYVLHDILAGCAVTLDSFDARRTWELIEAERTTHAFLPPTMLHAMLNVEGSDGFDCSSLRAIETGYEMSRRLRERAVSRFGDTIWYGYGSSEGTISFSEPSTLLSDPKCVGRVCGLDEIAIVDQNDQLVPDGVIGEIVGRGPSILPEYFDDPELTANALRNGWYHSGDLGRLEPGKLLHFEGRIKDMIKSGGYNVAAAEVEEAIASHPAVSAVAVVGTADDHWGEAVTAAVVLSTQEGSPTEADLLEYLRPRLARYKCPKRFAFVESLPVNPSGKVAKGELRRLLEETTPGRGATMIPAGRRDRVPAASGAASVDPGKQHGQAFGVDAVDWQVVDLSAGIPGAYATKLLADAGARVVKFESPDGDPLRNWAAGGHVVPEGEMGALFNFLSCSKESVVVDAASEPDLAYARHVLSRADLIVWSPEGPLAGVDGFDPTALGKHAPTATVIAITPFGLSGPWSDLPASELTLQAWTGAAGRGLPSEPPRTMGGYLGEWIGGVFAAVGGAISRLRPGSPHCGEIVDIALLETLAFCQWNHEVTFYEMAGRPWHPHRTVNVPDIEPTKDGFVGFMVVTAQMWQDFCCMIDRSEWLEDESLYTYRARFARRDELVSGIHEWTTQRTTSEILEIAGAFRVPAAPLGDGASIPLTEHFLAEGLFVKNPGADFLQPALPYRLGSSVPTVPLRPAPRLGEHNEEDDAADADASTATTPSVHNQGSAPSQGLPLAGLRVTDFTSFWAGPLVSQALAMLGAEVIHIESPGHPDGFRGHTTKTDRDDLWWEWTPPFHASNTNKLGLTLDMTRPECREIAGRLISKSDIVIDNFSPRVMEHWGFSYDEVKRLREDIIMLRMPAFGLTGPWRNRNGFGPTMEQASGMSFLTGFPDGSPTSLLGPCDPIAGAHALFSLLLAVQHRRETGEGMLVEAIMVASALNVAAEQVITHSAYGTVLARTGNKGYRPGFQNLFACADREPNGDVRWVAIAASTERQIAALVAAVRGSASVEDARSALRSPAGLDPLDSQVSEWCALRPSSEVIAALRPAGIPVAKALLPHELREIEQLEARKFFEKVDHPITGVDTIARLPMRLSQGPEVFHRRPAPTLGEHNRKILSELLDIPVHEIAKLEADHSIGTRLVGHFRSR